MYWCTPHNIFTGNGVRSKENTSKNLLCLFSLCQPVTCVCKYSALRKYYDLVLQLFLVAFSWFVFLTCIVHLVPQNNSDFFSVNNEKVTWIICYFALMNVALFFNGTREAFRIIYTTWKVHIHIWGTFIKPQSVISCKTCSERHKKCSHLETIYKPDSI